MLNTNRLTGFFLAFLFLTFFCGCRKEEEQEEDDGNPPTLDLEFYASTSETYSKHCSFSDEFCLENRLIVSYTSYSMGDSFMLGCSSLINDDMEGIQATIVMRKMFPKSLLDSTDGKFFPKYDSDFYSMFKADTVPSHGLTGLTFILNYYGLTPYLYPSATPDPDNNFVITRVAYEKINWDLYKGIYNSGHPINPSARKVLVTFNYRCKLVTGGDPIMIKDGVFRAVFVDRER